jgi:hypothetical protein
MHYQRQRAGADLLKPPKARNGSGTRYPNGYRVIYINGKRIGEHRHVMEQQLGRKLVKGESVHHKNGVRDENRPENLELRVAAHRQGLSVEEAIAWAQEIILRYG